VVKHFNVGHKFTYVFLALSQCVFIQKYLHVAGLDLGVGLEDSALIGLVVLALTSASASEFWPRPRPRRFGLV